jgi:sorting nexin-8
MVDALAKENSLPIPQLDLSSIATPAGFAQYQPDIRSPLPTRAYSEDPWSVPNLPSAPIQNGSISNGAPSNISGTGLPNNWWRKQETVTVNILGQQGFILNRYLVYEVATDVSISPR